jgi:hypothetical protein
MQGYEEGAPIIEARAGVTGHHVRYVLAFGLLGSLIAFVVIIFYFGHDAIGKMMSEIWSRLNVSLIVGLTQFSSRSQSQLPYS